MSRIRLSTSASITPTPAGVILSSDLGTFQVTGADVRTFLERIAPLLDGTRDRDAITAELSDYAPKSVAAFLELLHKRGLIEEVPENALADDRLRGQDEFLRRWAGPEADPAARLAGGRVLLAGLEPWGAAAAVELAAAGIGALSLFDDEAARRDALAERLRGLAPSCRVDAAALTAIEEAAPADLIVAAIAPADAARVEQVARSSERASVRCLWAHVAGETAFLGPLSTPGRTACRLCAAAEAVNPPLGCAAADGARAALAPALLGHLAALEVIKIVSGYAPSILGGQLLVVDPATHETRLHTLVRLPWCRVCGRAAARAA
ncbi:MAG: TOMM precursor leader peptide-binding protein [Minicystis sp.]